MIQFQYPLQWAPQQPRTKLRKRAAFHTDSVSRAGDALVKELVLLGAKKVVISSNLQLRIRGDGFYAGQRVDDPGIAVFFELKNKPKTMACDKWDRVEHNIWALYLSVAAIRGLERWGGSEFLDGMFTGFAALPSPEMLTKGEGFALKQYPQYFSDCVSKDHLRDRYLRLAKELHPDVGGDAEEFAEMKRQYEALK